MVISIKKKCKYMKEIIYNVIGSAMEVHRVLGWGLLEAVYQEALSVELQKRSVEHKMEVNLPIFYKDVKLEKSYRMDLLVEDEIIIEFKAVVEITTAHRMQLFNYMRLTKKKYGVLINFGELNLHCERYIYDDKNNECYLVDRNLNRVNY